MNSFGESARELENYITNLLDDEYRPISYFSNFVGGMAKRWVVSNTLIRLTDKGIAEFKYVSKDYRNKKLIYVYYRKKPN